MSDDQKPPTGLTVLPPIPVHQDPRSTPGGPTTGPAPHADPPPPHRDPTKARKGREAALAALSTLQDFLLNEGASMTEEELTQRVNSVLEDYKTRSLAFLVGLAKVRAESASALIIDLERVETSLLSVNMDSLSFSQKLELYKAIMVRDKLLTEQLNEITKLSVPGTVRIKDEEAVLSRLTELGLDIPNIAGRRNVLGFLDRFVREAQQRKDNGEPTN